MYKLYVYAEIFLSVTYTRSLGGILVFLRMARMWQLLDFLNVNAYVLSNVHVYSALYMRPREFANDCTLDHVEPYYKCRAETVGRGWVGDNYTSWDTT